eukprot:Gb_03082 [translate_table: standard]
MSCTNNRGTNGMTPQNNAPSMNRGMFTSNIGLKLANNGSGITHFNHNFVFNKNQTFQGGNMGNNINNNRGNPNMFRGLFSNHGSNNYEHFHENKNFNFTQSGNYNGSLNNRGYYNGGNGGNPNRGSHDGNPNNGNNGGNNGGCNRCNCRHNGGPTLVYVAADNSLSHLVYEGHYDPSEHLALFLNNTAQQHITNDEEIRQRFFCTLHDLAILWFRYMHHYSWAIVQELFLDQFQILCDLVAFYKGLEEIKQQFSETMHNYDGRLQSSGVSIEIRWTKHSIAHSHDGLLPP